MGSSLQSLPIVLIYHMRLMRWFATIPLVPRLTITGILYSDNSRKDAKAQRENGNEVMTENEIGKTVVDAAIAVHRALGPGLLETVYEIVLAHVLSKRGLHVDRQAPVSIEYDGIRFDEGFRADMIIEKKVILELKSVEKVSAAHKKQIQTYLRLTGLKLGFLLNFGEALMKHGITRAVNNLEE